MSIMDKTKDLYFVISVVTAIVLTFILIIAVVFHSLVWVTLIAGFYIACALWGIELLSYLASVALNWNILSDSFVPKFQAKSLCGVCNSDNCKRHKLLPHSARVKVPKDFDKALEELLEELLQTYVCTWYSEFSTDEAFIQQLRLAIATAARNVTTRLLRADTAAIVFYYLIPLALQHAQDWNMLVKRSKREGGKPEDYVASTLSSKIHPASYSRKAELNYLRGIVKALMPQLLPAIYVSTNNKVILREILANWIILPALDALADPENINTLVILSTTRSGLLSYTEDSVNVPMLRAWVMLPVTTESLHVSLKPSLDDVLNDPHLLYLFMQHIKESGPMNLLQFCLDIDDLSKRMLNPEMTAEIEESLFTDVQNMYSVYLDVDGPEYLHLPLHISIGMREILEGGPEKIQELRTSRPLYEAHQEAHALLEATCLPSFHHSYQLYDLLCGQPMSNTRTKLSAQINAIGGASTMSTRLSSQLGKIGGVLRTSTIDGSPFQQEQIYRADEVECATNYRSYSAIDGFDEKSQKDLTAWRVSVPHVDGGGAQPLYMVAVHSVTEGKSWMVLRRDQDFYNLRTRLTEFHGDRELNDSPLPSRKNQHPSITANRQRYQEFLQKLLAKPMLKSSELLYTFLTAPNLKPYYPNYSTPDIGILYQSMAHKLRKEKGQHLDKFMSTFLASTNVKYEHMDIGVELSGEQNINDAPRKGRDLVNGLFGNNLGFSVDHCKIVKSLASQPENHVKGACFCIAEAMDSFLSIPWTVSRILWMLASLTRHTMDPLINVAFYNVLVKLLSEGRAAIVVTLLHTTITSVRNREKSLSSEEKCREIYEIAREGLHSLLPWWLVGLRAPWNKLMDSLLDSLQYAPFNKHLAYFLLDHLLVNLFPEFTG